MIIRTKHDGWTYEQARRVFDSGSSAPDKTTQVSELPDWARPYAQETMGKASALASSPYQQYQGDRQAQFTPLQQQAYAGAEALGPSQIGQQAQGIAGQAAQGALGAQGQFNPYQTGQFTGQTAQNYMNPYMQNVVNSQMQEASRQSQIAGTQQQAQATQAGAFGGGRDAIMRAERERNLGTLQNDIMAKGTQQAYDQGRAQFNTENQLGEQSKQFGAGLGMQGYQTALSGAGTMGTLGAQQFGQQSDAIKLQGSLGSQQQGQVQSILDQQYGDFQAQQKYPYQQLEFQSNMIRGTPSGTTTSIYQPGPSTLAQVAGLGSAAYGMSKMMAKGGRVKAKSKKGSGLADLMVSKIT
jgi:hypothetical protein